MHPKFFLILYPNFLSKAKGELIQKNSKIQKRHSMNKFTKKQFENHWKSIGYEIPDDTNIRKWHRGYYKLIEQQMTSLDQIFGAFFASTQDRNGFSMGIFMACSDCFAYAAMYLERDVAVMELLPYTKIQSFAVANSDEGKPIGLIINIYGKDVKVLGFNHEIPKAFMQRLQEVGILKTI